MRNERAWSLLGGYATNSLTAEERQTLLEAALEDQELFDAVQKEQPLKELLDDPASRREILAELQRDRKAGTGGRWWWAWAGVAAAAVICTVVIARWNSTPPLGHADLAMSRKLEAPAIQSVPPNEPMRDLAVSKSHSGKLKKAAPKSPGERLMTASDTAARLPGAPPPRAMAKSAAGAPGATFGGAMALRSKVEAEASARIATSLLPQKISYVLLRRTETGDYESVPRDTAFHAGDAVRVRVRAPGVGTLTLSERSADGSWKPLGGNVPTVANENYDLPSVAAIEGATAKILMLTFEPQPPGTPAIIEVIPIQRE